MSIAAIALSGLGQVHARVQASAERLAKISSAPQDTVDLSAEIIGLAQAKIENGALLAALQTDSEMTAQTLNILA